MLVKECRLCAEYGIHCEQEIVDPNSRFAKLLQLIQRVEYDVFINDVDALIIKEDMESCTALQGLVSPKVKSKELKKEFERQKFFAGQTWGGQ